MVPVCCTGRLNQPLCYMLMSSERSVNRNMQVGSLALKLQGESKPAWLHMTVYSRKPAFLLRINQLTDKWFFMNSCGKAYKFNQNGQRLFLNPFLL